MKTLKTTTKIIALAFVCFAISFTAAAEPMEEANYPDLPKLNYANLFELDAEFMDIENDLIAEGVLECPHTEILVVLGENDEIVYQGTSQLEDGNNAFLVRLLTKADYIMSSGDKKFYKVF